MKVVLFCGGLGTRMREYSQRLPKPLADIRQRPILWYVMKYYAHFGHKDFILCMGYKAEVIKDYFEHHMRNPGTPYLIDGEPDIPLYGEDIDSWNVTLVDTGERSPIGSRLKSVEAHIGSDELFMANYSDGVTDLHLPTLIDYARAQDRVGTMLAVNPNHSFHTVNMNATGEVSGIVDLRHSGVMINGGYFVFKRKIFDYINWGDDLVAEPFARLIDDKQLVAHTANAYWACMDTFKDKEQLEQMLDNGKATWRVWDQPAAQVLAEPITR
jgi:glucose-1-phosphate cytidylyltransferase